MNIFSSFIQYKKNNQRCSNLDYFQFKELTAVDFPTVKGFNSVFQYGNYLAVEKIIGRKFNFLIDYLEHGTNWGTRDEDVLAEGYANRCGIKNIFTFSEDRKQTIELFCKRKKIHRNVFSIGPYIVGAENFYEEKERMQIKDRYGRILLVYPIHSSFSVKQYYDIEVFINGIRSIQGQFDTVFVCLFWKDIIHYPNFVKKYQDEGYVIVSNGHGSDSKFLSRQKDLIMLSDMMLTNGLGTHVGYAICLDCPVYMLRPEYSSSIREEQVADHLIYPEFGEVEKKIYDAFGTFSYTINESQKKLIQKYWGRWR